MHVWREAVTYTLTGTPLSTPCNRQSETRPVPIFVSVRIERCDFNGFFLS